MIKARITLTVGTILYLFLSSCSMAVALFRIHELQTDQIFLIILLLISVSVLLVEDSVRLFRKQYLSLKAGFLSITFVTLGALGNIYINLVEQSKFTTFDSFAAVMGTIGLCTIIVAISLILVEKLGHSHDS
jgi:hypothetical protein